MGTKPKENPDDVPLGLRCMNPDCRDGNPRAGSRGICKNCYGRLYYWIVQKKTTWKKLENKGICKPSINALSQALSRRK